jgi:hypothetical protein
MVPVRAEQGQSGADPWLVRPYAKPEDLISGVSTDITGTTSTQVIAAQGQNLRIYVTHLLVQNSHASVGTWVNVKDGTGSTLYTVYAASGGAGASCPLPAPLKTSAGSALNAICETTGSNVRVSASGFRGP